MQEELIKWYKENKRDLPFRDIDDPYKVWISEIMLQQTQVNTVIPYYLRFIERFPNVEAIALSSLDDVYKYWEGLGYYRRAKHIYEASLYIYHELNNEFPKDYQSLLKLKGIGEYTASAICSFAYHLPYCAVDGNALRVLSRVFRLHENIALKSTITKITKLGNELVQGYPSHEFNQAIMDFAHAYCTPTNPLCVFCPLNNQCLAYINHEEKILPINIKKVKQSDHRYITGIINYHGNYMFIKRDSGLLEHMFGLIQYECNDPYEFIDLFEKEFKQKIIIKSYIKDMKHVFSHQTWYMSIYLFEIEDENNYLYTLNEINKLAIPTAHKKVFDFYSKNFLK